jgi:hypothetical protein
VAEISRIRGLANHELLTIDNDMREVMQWALLGFERAGRIKAVQGV